MHADEAGHRQSCDVRGSSNALSRYRISNPTVAMRRAGDRRDECEGGQGDDEDADPEPITSQSGLIRVG